MGLSFLKRASLTLHPVAQRLFRIMENKKSNLVVALDTTSQKQLLQWADELGPSVAMIKTHVDILEDFTPDFGDRIQALADKHRFLIFEDRKFADIGHTVSLQYEKGIYRIVEWADLVNAHVVPGPGVIEGLKMKGLARGRGLLLLAEMSSLGNLATGTYTQKAVQMAREHSDFVMGFIALHQLTQEPGFLHFAPGVQLSVGTDALGQCYRTVEEVIQNNGVDLVIVGRAITQAADPVKEAMLYRDRSWKAYLRKCDSCVATTA